MDEQTQGMVSNTDTPEWMRSRIAFLEQEIRRLPNRCDIDSISSSEYEAILQDLRELCRLIGEFDGARPESPHMVFQACLDRLRKDRVPPGDKGQQRCEN